MNSPNNYEFFLVNVEDLTSCVYIYIYIYIYALYKYYIHIIYVYVSFSLSILDSIPNKNHHLLPDPAAISFKNLQLDQVLPQTYAQTKSPSDFNTFFGFLCTGT